MISKKALKGRINIGVILTLFAIVTTSSLADDLNGAGVPQTGPILATCEEGTVALGIESLGDKVLLYCGNGGNCSEGLVGITNLYVSMGVTVDTLFAFPADLSVYKLIFLVMPHVDFDAAQTSALDTFVMFGGRLVLLSDWPGFYNGHAVLNKLLNDLSVSIQVKASPVDAGCEQFTSHIEPDQITEGIASFEYAYTDTLTVSSPAKVLVKTKDGTEVTVAVGQPPGAPTRPGADVVVAGDSNSFTDLCNPVVNEDFWWNLYNFEVLIDVLVDIKPGSCPNPLNPKGQGSIPVAIVGTEDFDPVAIVDPSSVTLAGVPMNGIVEIVDSTQPHESNPDAEECYDCFDADANLNFDSDGDGVMDTYIGDGYMDLVVKFDTQALVAAIADMGGIGPDQCMELALEGATYGGTPILGSDEMLVRKGIEASPAPPGAHNLTTTWGNIKSR